MKETRGRSILAIGVLLSLVGAMTGVSAAAIEEADSAKAAYGSTIFRTYCVSCHGDQAKGDGVVAEHLRIKPADLTRISADNGGEFPFDQVVQIIDGQKQVKGHGRGEMPVWGDAFQRVGQSEEKTKATIDQLAHYIWSLQKD